MPRAFAALVLGGLLIGGCARQTPQQAPVAVRGKVFDARKKAMAGVIVRFWPQPTHASSTDGLTTADGSFEVQCVPGKYEVTLQAVPLQFGGEPAAMPAPDAKKGSAPRASFPVRFKDVAKTPWRDIDVPDGGRDGVELVIAE